MTSTQNSISAADTSIGFDYQFYYFFYTILGLQHGEKIGLEVKDDVHLETSNGNTILIQTKHSIQTNSNGDIINLTEKDKDLWKTISNWVKILGEQPDKTSFLNKTTFQLVSNKKNSINPFFSKIQSAKSGELTIREFKDYLKELRDSTSDSNIKEYINTLYKLKHNELSKFIEKVRFELSEDNLIVRIKRRILEKIFEPNRVDDVYNSLHSALRDNNYLLVKRGERNEISFQKFMSDYKHCFKIGFSSKLPIRDIPIILPSNPENQNFIRQLLEIHALQSLDHEEIIELTTHMLMMYNNLSAWETNGDIGESGLKNFEQTSILIWKNSFRSKYREIIRRHNNGDDHSLMEDEIQQAALNCLDELRRASLTIEDTQLDTMLSNGHFYLLTEAKNIGWHFDWKTKYAV